MWTRIANSVFFSSLTLGADSYELLVTDWTTIFGSSVQRGTFKTHIERFSSNLRENNIELLMAYIPGLLAAGIVELQSENNINIRAKIQIAVSIEFNWVFECTRKQPSSLFNHVLTPIFGVLSIQNTLIDELYAQNQKMRDYISDTIALNGTKLAPMYPVVLPKAAAANTSSSVLENDNVRRLLEVIQQQLVDPIPTEIPTIQVMKPKRNHLVPTPLVVPIVKRSTEETLQLLRKRQENKVKRLRF